MPTIVVEDGTGSNPDVNSYLDVAGAQSIFDTYGEPQAWTDASTQEKEQSLTKATRWVDTVLQPMGFLVERDQPLNFPRTDFVDNTGRFVEQGTIPDILKQVVAEAAAIQLTTDLNNSFSSVGVTSESYGSTSVTYSGTERSALQKQLKPLLKWLGRYGSAGLANIIPVSRG